jgi:hypothetical protein
MLFKRGGSGFLDHIKYVGGVEDKRDHFLQMVLDTFHTTNWVETYGLSVTDTMDLEFSEYIRLVSALKAADKRFSEQHGSETKE